MTSRERPRLGASIAILVGTAVLVAATLAGWSEGWLDAIVRPGPLIQAGLVGASVVLGAALLVRAISRLEASGTHDVPGLIRAVRLAFLAVAAFAASTAWALGHPLPLVVAAVIAAIDVIETSFLLLVVGRR